MVIRVSSEGLQSPFKPLVLKVMGEWTNVLWEFKCLLSNLLSNLGSSFLPHSKHPPPPQKKKKKHNGKLLSHETLKLHVHGVQVLICWRPIVSISWALNAPFLQTFQKALDSMIIAMCEIVIHNLQIDHIAKNQHNLII
jgi:hypothetical protein